MAMPAPTPSFLTDEQVTIHERLCNDLVYAAEKCGKIKDKAGNIVPLILNKPQLFVHEKLEEQRKKTGKVRAIIIKGRQEGISTYIAFRYYWRMRMTKGRSTFILSHEAATTQKLFSIVKRYYDNTPLPLQPTTKASNLRELKFDQLDCEYYVGTAGNEKVGVGGTVQLFHGSEFALWPNAEEITAGVLQSIGNEPGTEIIFETTARGMGNKAYQMTIAALKGENEYQVIFVPWFWMAEYRMDPGPGFVRTPEEDTLAKTYGLDDMQLRWRRLKISELGSEWLFKREYPCNVIEAFQTSAKGLFDAPVVWTARKTASVRMPNAAKILGVDGAGNGENADRTIFALRQGRTIPWYKKYPRMRPMEMAGLIAREIEKEKLDAVIMDYAHGFGPYDRLCELGFRDVVFPVHFGSAPAEPKVYANKRAEIICAVKLWMDEGGTSIPDDDEIYADFMCMPNWSENSNNLRLFPPKETIRKLLGMSPDILDAVALTFAFPVRAKNADSERNKWTNKSHPAMTRQSPLSVLNAARGLIRGNDGGRGISIQTRNWLGGGMQ